VGLEVVLQVVLQVIVQVHQRFCRGSAEVPRFSRGGAGDAGAEVQMQRFRCRKEVLQKWCRGAEVQERWCWCRGAEVQR